uniref:Guanidino acid hydrolase, mitochondrial n=1 Tax=Monodon monoceros TaxID=40151 RepID=A0A8C6AVF3_MONMO
MAILLPLHPPIPHQQQKECVRPRGGRASSGGRPHSPLSVPGSRLRGCRTRAHTARGSCAARSRRRPAGKRSPRRGPSAHSTRFGPRRIREESVLLRTANPSTGALPFQSLMVADLGDVNVNLYNLQDSCRLIREAYQKIVAAGCIPLTLGGDHTITYPILQAVAEKHGPMGLVHVDAHMDVADKALGEKLYHGTPFRRCVDEGLLDCKRVVQIGIRGSSMTLDTYRYSRSQGFRVVLAEDCWMKSLVPLMGKVRQQMGVRPIYISFDIDGLDPAYAPGTGTPEIAGLTPSQALEIIRGCQGLNVVGCDLVEVSPPYDPSGNTALVAANLLFEMLCVLPKVTVA